jgi:hypothetical protein
MAAMRLAAGVLVACLSGALLVGCPSRKSAGDKAPEAGAPAPTTASVQVEAAAPVAAAAAANAADVLRYPDETPIDHALGTTHVFASSVRTEASATTGAVVDVLKAETDVDEVAERQGFVLVYFIDPKDPSRKLTGWVAKSDFTAPAVRPTGTVAPPGTIPPPATVPPPAQRPLDVRQEHGSCPGGYARCGAMCRLECGSSADCGGAHCLHGLCLGAGSAPCAH